MIYNVVVRLSGWRKGGEGGGGPACARWRYFVVRFGSLLEEDMGQATDYRLPGLTRCGRGASGMGQNEKGAEQKRRGARARARPSLSCQVRWLPASQLKTWRAAMKRRGGVGLRRQPEGEQDKRCRGGLTLSDGPVVTGLSPASSGQGPGSAEAIFR